MNSQRGALKSEQNLEQYENNISNEQPNLNNKNIDTEKPKQKSQ